MTNRWIISLSFRVSLLKLEWFQQNGKTKVISGKATEKSQCFLSHFSITSKRETGSLWKSYSPHLGVSGSPGEPSLLLSFMWRDRGRWGFPGGQAVKNPANAGDAGSIPGLERYPGAGERNGNSLQHPYLEIPWTEELGSLQSMGRKESDTTGKIPALLYGIIL